MGPSIDSADDAQDVYLLMGVRSLALLLPESENAGHLHDRIAKRLVSSIDDREFDAVCEFLHAGQRCLAKLAGDTLLKLRQIGCGFGSVKSVKSVSADLAPLGDNDQMQSVLALLEKYDSNADGVLSQEEFREAFKQVASEDLNDEEINQLASVVDINGDGQIDILEFTLWLYGKKKAESQKQQSEKQTTDLKNKLKALKAELEVKTRAIEHMEDDHEAEMESSLNFWRSIAAHAVMTIDSKINLATAEWLGNGKYGFVLKATRSDDSREVVVKMMGIRWAHLAVQEWQFGTLVGRHPNIVDCDDVMLHNDDDSSIREMLLQGYDSGKLKSRHKRSKFPDRYICLTQEFMNRGTVQDWMDQEILMPGGLLVVMQRVASALSFMHGKGVAHNDIKPENIMLHQMTGSDREEVVVKLGDLGLAKRSTDMSADFSQYGMTVFCMVTGAKFGSRKYRPDHVEGFVQECEAICGNTGLEPPLGPSLESLPSLLRLIYHGEVSMDQVSSWPTLQNFSFFDGEVIDPVDELARSHGAKAQPCESHKVLAMNDAHCRKVVDQVVDDNKHASTEK